MKWWARSHAVVHTVLSLIVCAAVAFVAGDIAVPFPTLRGAERMGETPLAVIVAVIPATVWLWGSTRNLASREGMTRVSLLPVITEVVSLLSMSAAVLGLALLLHGPILVFALHLILGFGLGLLAKTCGLGRTAALVPVSVTVMMMLAFTPHPRNPLDQVVQEFLVAESSPFFAWAVYLVLLCGVVAYLARSIFQR